jgi:D-arabinose 1-dehydrogenase-like Zn-dependent alcohol dehydrogenase
VFYKLLYYVQILVSLTYTPPILTNTLLLSDYFQVILGDSRSISNKNFTLSGSLVGNFGDISRTLDFARGGILNPPINIFGIDQLPEAVARLAKGEMAGRAVVDFNTYIIL